MEIDKRIQGVVDLLATKKAVTDEYSIRELAAVYTAVVVELERPDDAVKAFRDKATAVARVNGVIGELVVQRKLDKKATPKVDEPKTEEPAAPKAKTEEPAAPKAKAEKAKTGRGGARVKVDPALTITIDAENPHRKGTKDYDKFRKLATGMTVEQATGKGVEVSYLTYAAKRGILTIK